MTSNRLVLVAGVLAAGFAAAWPFRHPRAVGATTTTSTQPIDLPLRAADVVLHVSPQSDPSPAVGLDQLCIKDKARRPAELAAADEAPVAPELETLGGPPAFSQGYSTLLPKIGEDGAILGSPYAIDASYRAPVAGLDPSVDEPSKLEQGPSLREHRIVDGDTLDGLAQRYLGDTARREEIFELNRDRLRDPLILPVGKRLRIPQHSDRGLTPVLRASTI